MVLLFIYSLITLGSSFLSLIGTFSFSFFEGSLTFGSSSLGSLIFFSLIGCLSLGSTLVGSFTFSWSLLGSLISLSSLHGSFISLLGSFEAIAYGAAIQAAIINNYEDDDLERLILLDIIPVSLGIELGNGTIFLKNT